MVGVRCICLEQKLSGIDGISKLAFAGNTPFIFSFLLSGDDDDDNDDEDEDEDDGEDKESELNAQWRPLFSPFAGGQCRLFNIV